MKTLFTYRLLNRITNKMFNNFHRRIWIFKEMNNIRKHIKNPLFDEKIFISCLFKEYLQFKRDLEDFQIEILFSIIKDAKRHNIDLNRLFIKDDIYFDHPYYDDFRDKIIARFSSIFILRNEYYMILNIIYNDYVQNNQMRCKMIFYGNEYILKQVSLDYYKYLI